MSDPGYVRNSRRTTYENRWLRFEAHDMVHPNGQPGEHGVVITPRSSGVVVLDGDDVVLALQARYAVDRMVLEIVKGGAAGEESAQAAAERELREELGIAAARWDALGIIYEIPSIMQEPISLFLARDVTAVASDPEDVETVNASRLPFRAALRAAGRGEIADAVTAAALFRVAQFLEDEKT
ncbi:MAG TPA: NUDIX hydrolase [Candidatus Lustribacter sp.]|nr:NUDIX hydrolase [Candidatus Lustribacter sp.]